MRIGLLTTSYPRDEGDFAGRFVAELCAWLVESQADEVEVLAPAPARAVDPVVRVVPLRYADEPRLFFGDGAPDNLLSATGRAGWLDRQRLRTWVQVPAFIGRLLLETRRRQASWDAVISHWLVPCGLCAALAAPRLPHLAIAHSTDVHLLSRIGPVLGAPLLDLLGRRRTALVLTSESLRPRLAALARSRRALRLVRSASVQRMGIVWPRPLFDEQVRALRDRVGLAGRLVVLFVGRLAPVKGVDRLLRACARATIGPPPVIVVVGGGGERRRLEALAAACGCDARFVGVQGGQDKQLWLQAADLLVLPSVVLAHGRTESAPVVLLEAMAAGLPVVATEVGGVGELVRDGHNGLLVPPDDVGALAAAIERLGRSPQLRAAIAARGRETARQHTWAVVGPLLRARLQRICRV